MFPPSASRLSSHATMQLCNPANGMNAQPQIETNEDPQAQHSLRPELEILPPPPQPRSNVAGSSIKHPVSSIQDPETNIQHPPITRTRNGKIARLPKLERDMVNRMLQNNIRPKKIVGALDEVGIRVTTRNISNWKT